MSQPNSPKVTVRVEVIVEGADGQTTVVSPEIAPAPRLARVIGPFETDVIAWPKPTVLGSPANAPVYQIGGLNKIEANGIALTHGGSFPSRVYAKAYPNPSLDPYGSGLGVPPTDAAVDTPLTNGSWSFTFAKGNPVPGAAFDSNPSSTSNNSTLIVWYDYGGSPHLYSIESARFHGLLAGSVTPGSATIGSMPTVGTHPIRFATFCGPFAALNPVVLRWDGSCWSAPVGELNSVAYFVCLGAAHHFLLVGPSGTTLLTGSLGSQTPFVWSGTGAGTGTGPQIQIIVTE